MTRGYLTKREWSALLQQQNGKCCVAGCESEGPFEGEHTVCNYYVGGKPDALMCIPHHREKTRKDKREIARTKRLNGETSSQYERRKKFGPTMKSRNTFRSHHRYG